MMITKSTRLIILSGLFLVSGTLLYQSAHAYTSASASADAKIKIIKALKITKDTNKDLLFPEAAVGDAAASIATGDSYSAQFTVDGEPSHNYTITLPAAAINMTTGTGDTAAKKIAVDTWVSSPAAGNNGVLSTGGTQALKVGASRAAIATDQVTGDYVGSFTVSVIYY